MGENWVREQSSHVKIISEFNDVSSKHSRTYSKLFNTERILYLLQCSSVTVQRNHHHHHHYHHHDRRNNGLCQLLLAKQKFIYQSKLLKNQYIFTIARDLGALIPKTRAIFQLMIFFILQWGYIHYTNCLFFYQTGHQIVWGMIASANKPQINPVPFPDYLYHSPVICCSDCIYTTLLVFIHILCPFHWLRSSKKTQNIIFINYVTAWLEQNKSNTAIVPCYRRINTLKN
jgi:hypothetical protein